MNGVGTVMGQVAEGLRGHAHVMEDLAQALDLVAEGMAYGGAGDVNALTQGVVLKLLGIATPRQAVEAVKAPWVPARPCDVNTRALDREQTVVVWAGSVSSDHTLAVGLCTDGKRRVLGLSQGTSADPLAMKTFLEDLYTRGLGVCEGPSLLWVTDGARALDEAIRRTWSEARMGLCRTTLETHVLAQVSETTRPAVRRTLREAFAQGNFQEAESNLRALERRLEDAFPGAYEVLSRGRRGVLLLKQLELDPTLEAHLASLSIVHTAYAQARSLGRIHASAGEETLPYGVEAWEARTRRVVGFEHMPRLIEALTRLSHEAA